MKSYVYMTMSYPTNIKHEDFAEMRIRNRLSIPYEVNILASFIRKDKVPDISPFTGMSLSAYELDKNESTVTVEELRDRVDTVMTAVLNQTAMANTPEKLFNIKYANLLHVTTVLKEFIDHCDGGDFKTAFEIDNID